MIVGIMADSHGDVARTVRAIELIKEHAPVHVFHCGDIGTQQIITELEAGFADPEVPVTCVLGNCDGWNGHLTPALDFVRVWPRLADITIGDKKIAVSHGHEIDRFEEVCMSGQYNYVFTGHTHVRSDDHFNDTRIINPGALHRTRVPSCATLNLETDELTYLELR